MKGASGHGERCRGGPRKKKLDGGLGENASLWMRVFSRMVLGHADSSPLIEMSQGRKVDIKLSRPTRCEFDVGARAEKKRLRARMERGAIVVRVPAPDQ